MLIPALHTDDGGKYAGSSMYASKFFGGNAKTACFVGDTIGCGILRHGETFWTKNGNMLEFAPYRLELDNLKKVRPTISLLCPGDSARINFGTVPFRFTLSELSSYI